MSCTAPLQSLRGVLRVWGSLRRAPETLKLQSTIGRCSLANALKLSTHPNGDTLNPFRRQPQPHSTLNTEKGSQANLAQLSPKS